MSTQREKIRRLRRSEWSGRFFEGLESRVLLDAWDDISDFWSSIPDTSSSGIDVSSSDNSTQSSGNGQMDNSQDNTQDNSGYSDSNGFPDTTDDYTPPEEIRYAPSAPAMLTAQSPSATSVYLSWINTTADQDSVKVERFGPDGKWRTIAKLHGDATHFTDSTVQAGSQYSYAVVACNDAGSSDYSNIATITPENSSDPTLIGTFGHLPGGTASVPFSFFDGDGTEVTLTVNGTGEGEVHLNPDGYDLSLVDTTLKSSFTISTRRSGTAGDDGRFAVNDLTVGTPGDASDHTALGTLSARTTDFSGDLTITGPAANVMLGNVSGETIAIGAPAVAPTVMPSVSLSAGQMADTTVDSAIGIKSLTAVTWTDSDAGVNPDSLTAPFLGTLKMTGAKKSGATAAVAGDFDAALDLSGAGVTKGNALGSVSVAGAVPAVTWNVTGKIGSLTVGSLGESGAAFVLENAGDVGSMSLGNVRDAELGDDAVPLGVVGAVSAKEWDAGSLTAKNLGSLKISGAKASGGAAALAGNLTMGLTLTGAVKGVTLGSASVAGQISGVWEIAGGVGAISAKSAEGWSLAASDVAGAAGTVKSVTLSDVHATNSGVEIGAAWMGNLTVKGNLEASAVALRQVPDRKRQALGSLVVGGTATDFVLRSAGNVGAIRAGVLDHSMLFAGVLGGGVGLPGAGDFAAAGVGGVASIGSVTVPGVKGQAAVLIDSDVAAPSIGRATVARSAGAVVDEDLSGAFGFATVVKVANYVGPGSSGFYVSGMDGAVV